MYQLEITLQNAWLPIAVTTVVVNALVLYMVIKWALSEVTNRQHRELLEQIKLQNQLKIYELMQKGSSADQIQEQIDIAFKRKGTTTLVAHE